MKPYKYIIIGAVIDLIATMIQAYLQNVYFEILWATLLICQVIGLATAFLYNEILNKQ